MAGNVYTCKNHNLSEDFTGITDLPCGMSVMLIPYKYCGMTGSLVIM